ncbi:hypothetical protein PG996_007554 [Apiospora saccharicola]|uniref:DUF946 domain-containing protein n=1 Tax=Apiospora saccharicola TaxID=335842 RepID=A0ABR1VB53_9PEZI
MSNATMDYEDLRVTMTSSYDWKYNDTDTGCKYAVTFYHPKSQGDLRPLGSIVLDNYNSAQGKRATLLVGTNPEKSASPPVKAPTSFTWVWDDKGTGGKHAGTIWKPVARAGYVAMGHVVTNNYQQPSTDVVWCLRADLDDTRSGGKYNCSCWAVYPAPNNTKGSEDLPVLTDTFYAHRGYDAPAYNLAKTLKLRLTKQYKSFDQVRPTMTEFMTPGEQFNRMLQCSVKLPFVAFFPPTDEKCLRGIGNPFCTLSRYASWTVEGAWKNHSHTPFEHEASITTGVTQEKSSTLEHSAGITATASGGMGCVNFSVSLNYQFTSSNTVTYGQYQEETIKKKIAVPGGRGMAILSKMVEMECDRPDGSSVRTTFPTKNDVTIIDMVVDQGKDSEKQHGTANK